MPVGANRRLLNLEESIAVARYIQTAGTPPGAWTYGGATGGNVKTNRLVSSPPKQIMVRVTGGDPRGSVIASRFTIIEVRDEDIKLVLPTVKMVLELFDKKAPPLEGMSLYFEWDGRDDHRRDQNNRVVVPLGFVTTGHTALGAA